MQITPPFFAPYRQKKEDFFMSEKKVGKRLLTWVLVLVMTLSLLPLNVLAEYSISPASILPPDTKCITYVFYNGETKVDEQIIKTGDTLLEPEIGTQPGKRLKGWYTAQENGDLFTDFGNYTSEITENTTISLYARFEDVYYVYFKDTTGRIVATKEGVTGAEIKFDDVSFSVESDESITGWYTDSALTDKVDSVKLENTNVTLYAKVEKGHWIEFNSNGGSYVEPLFVRKGENCAPPTAPTKPGYDFAGWYDGNTEFTFGGALDSNKSLTAHWTAKNAVNYTVIHWLENADDDGYSYKESETLTGTAGSKTTASAKSYDGFTAQTITQETIKGDGSTIVNVRYTRNEYTITFYLDNPIYSCGKEEHAHRRRGLNRCYDRRGNLTCGKEEHSHSSSCKTTTLTITAKYGANISKQWPTVNGSKTWRVNKNYNYWNNTYQANINTMPLDGANFYGPATGTSSETAYYYVEILPGEIGTELYNGTSYKEHHHDTSVGSGFRITKEDIYQISGFTHVGGSSIGDKYDNAKFYYTRNSYNIIFINGGKTEKTESKKYQQDISDVSYTPTAPVGKEGYKFAGWYDNKLCEGDKYVFDGKTMPAQNITVYAKWVEPVHKVEFEVEGTVVDEWTKNDVAHNSTISDLPTPTSSTGDAFLGWVDANRKPFHPSTKITGDLTLHAKFGNKAGYSVTYVTAEGSSSVTDDKLYAEGAYATVRNGPSAAPKGEVFLYWTNNGKKYYPNDKVLVPKGGVTLTAVYGPVAETVTLTYNANFGTPPASKQISGLKNNGLINLLSYDELELPKRDGYTFTGWNTQRDGHGISFAAGTSAARVDKVGPNVLYAQWKKTTIDEEVTVIITGKTDTKVYNGSEQSITGYEVKSISNEFYKTTDFTFNGTALAKGTDAGTYPMGLKPENFENKNANFSKVTFVVTDGSLTITKRDVTLTSASGSKVYDGTALTKPEVTVTGDGFVTGEVTDIKATGTITDFGEVTNTITYNEGANFKADNYEITTTEGKLTITKRSVTLTSETANKVYDGTPLTKPEVTVTGDGFVTGEVTDIKATGTITDVGTVTNTITFAKGEKFKDSNYAITKTEGTLEVTPITDKVTVTITGNTKTVRYNGKEQSVTGFTYTAPEGVKVTPKDGFKPEAKGTDKGTYYMCLTKGDFTVSSKIYKEFEIIVKDGYLEITRSGGHHPRPKPTVEIEDDDALGLNTTDHFAYIVGYGNGEVRPQNNITRAEVATIFFRLLTDDVRDENLTKTNRYSDVAATSWYNTAVSTLSSMGIITGYPDGTFRPNAAITRAEFAAIAARFDHDGDKTAAKFSDIANHWAKDEISIAYNNGWITGYPNGTFGPQRDITRAETMTLVNRVLNRQPETEDDLLPNMTVWTDNANPKAWYYLAVQEATNSHYYKFKTNSQYEKWTELRETRDWTQLEK